MTYSRHFTIITVAIWGRVVGWSEWSLRFPSVFFGTLIPPLLAVTALALTRRRLAGALVALLAALHPLLVYYSQEARMYALLTALSVLLGYLIIHIASNPERRRLYWVAYVAVATAAVYTHYFAFFLLLALGIAFIADQLMSIPVRGYGSASPSAHVENGSKHVRDALLGFLLANILVLVLYLPWFAALITRLSVDSSYWQGEFKYDEALRHIAISFIGGETMLETQAINWFAPFALLTAVLLAALLLLKPRQWRTVLYSLLWLAVPVAAVLMLASIVPKFNARYVMIALPGLLLIWGAGLERFLRPTHSATAQSSSLEYVLRPTIGAVLASILLVSFLYADRNWFMDPAFTKAEWRHLAEYVRARMNTTESGNNDVVVLVSGHAWPVWNYYAPDLPPLRLPDLEILDVNAVLDFASSAIPLRDGLEGKDSAWLVSWQDEIVDPMSIVPLQLNLAGREQVVDGQFWQLQLRHYADMDAGAVLLEPTTISESSVNFGNQVYLLDYTVADNGDLLLFWQLHPDHPNPMPDLHIAGHTFTSDGLPFTRLNDRRLSSYEYPSFRWRKDQVTLGRIPAEDWAGPGALPGSYRIRMGVYELNGDLNGVDVIGAQGQPLGKQITMDLTLDRPTVGPDYVNEATSAELIVDLFVELILTDEQAEPGQLVGMELRWYAEERPAYDYDLLVRWQTRDDDVLAGEQILPLSPDFPTGAWPDDELLRTQHQLRPPLNLPAGDYWLEVGLTAPGSTFVRVPFRVLGSSRIFNPPPYLTEVDETFGEALHLLGIIEPVQREKQVRDQAVLTLVWQTLNRPPSDYSASVQWLGADARPVAQADLALPGGSSNWLPGQIELQTFIASSPKEPGDYRLVVAVYDANQVDLPRLRTSQGEDLVDLGTITVRP